MKIKKRSWIPLILALCMAFSSSAMGIAEDTMNIDSGPTFSEMTETQLVPYFNMAKKSAEIYYRKVTDGSTIEDESKNFSKKERTQNMTISNAVNEILDNKFDYETYYMKQMDYTKTYIEGSYELLDWKITGDALWCELFVKVVFQYSDFPLRSSIGEVVQIVIQNPNTPTIVDWYVDAPESFDAQVRGVDLDLSISSNRLTSKNFASISNKQNACMAIMEQAYTDNENKSQMYETQSSRQGPSTETVDPNKKNPTRREKAAIYAIQNAVKSTPASGDGTIPFAGYDPGCTEFVSHCLLAGDYSIVSGRNGYANCWFYSNNENKSTSWTSANYLFEFLTWNKGKNNAGPKVSSDKPGASSGFTADTNWPYMENTGWPSVTNGSVESAKIGDIIQIKYNYSSGYGYPKYGHSTIVTGHIYSPYPTKTQIIISYRTRSTSAKANIKLHEAYPPSPDTSELSGGHLYRKIYLDY